MAQFIDRRLNPQNKSAVNRQRFLKRYKAYVREAVRKAIDKRKLDDMDRGEKVTIPAKEISEPRFSHGSGGSRSIVHPGNREFITGDRIERPSGGGRGSGEGGESGQQGEGGEQASNSGEAMDSFVFEISRDEFMEIVFEDLALPNLAKRHLAGVDQFKRVHGGYSTDGNPSALHVVRTCKSALARRIAMTGGLKRSLRALEQEFEQTDDEDVERLESLQLEMELLQSRIRRVPFLDDNDLRYRRVILRPDPSARAVMFCLMDVSGSMDERTKLLAKRYFLLLYLFLKRNYERVEVVFIRYHTRAEEVDEETFFYSRETGGTVASTALDLMHEIIQERYPPSQWNIYGSQASDGDNWYDDTPACVERLRGDLLPVCQFFSYVEINSHGGQDLWHYYSSLEEEFPGQFAQREIQGEADVFQALRELFKKRTPA